jgi:Tfp pilus assembly protein PilZ
MLMANSANGAFAHPSRLHDQGAAVRIPFVHGCLLTTPQRVRGGLVCNLSVQGVYVTLDEPLPECGDAIHVLVQLPGQAPLLEADTIVTWQNRRPSEGIDSLPPGVGLRFVTLAASCQETVATLVKQHHERSEDSELVLPNLPHAGPKRVACVQRCSFTTKAGPIETLLCNLSRLGAYVTVKDMPEVGDEVALSFEIPKERVRLDLKGRVAWRNPVDPHRPDPLAPGCGIRFVGLSAQDEARICGLIEGPGPAQP